MKTLTIISTHPIQYNAPWFKLLSERPNINLKVFYTWSQAKKIVDDKDFGQKIEWDIPLLDGYDFEFVENKAKRPGIDHYFGIRNPDLIKKINDFNPDVILIFGWNFHSHFKIMRQFKGKTSVWFRGDSTLLDESGGFKTQLRRTVLSFVYKFVDKALYVGSDNKEYFKRHGLLDERLIYAPHAIDNQRFGKNSVFKNNEVQKWRNELGYSENDIVVLFAGKFEEKKQPQLLLEVITKINENREEPIKLLFVGNGVLEARLKAKAKGKNYVQFLPFQNQSKMPLVYRVADVFCLPSNGPGETWGLAVNEAMASGTAALVSDKVGCARDLIVHGENGFIFESLNASQLKSIIETLNLSKLKDMGIKASERIKHWSYANLINAIEDNL